MIKSGIDQDALIDMFAEASAWGPGEPSPHNTTLSSPRSFASTHFLINAGITCEVCMSKLSPGPYRFTGNRTMALKPYCCRYACACTSIIFLAKP